MYFCQKCCLTILLGLSRPHHKLESDVPMPPPNEHSGLQDTPGAAIVGTMEILPTEARLAVHCLRCRNANDGCALKEALDEGDTRLVAAMEGFCALIEAYGRRPLQTLPTGTPTLTADEATIGHCLSAAARLQRDEVLMFAMLLCRADVAPCLAGEAEALALRFKSLRHATHHKTSKYLN